VLVTTQPVNERRESKIDVRVEIKRIHTMTHCVDKHKYEIWQTSLINAIWNDPNYTAFLQRKTVVAVCESTDLHVVEKGRLDGTETYATPVVSNKIRLYHLQSGKLEGVGYGFRFSTTTNTKVEFRLAGTDTGGLTNVTIKEGEALAGNLTIVKGVPLASELYTLWLKKSGKKQFEGISVDAFGLFYGGVCKQFKSPCFVLYTDTRVRPRKIVDADTIFKLSGHYYIRNRQSTGNQCYARDMTASIERKTYYCGVTDAFVKPNMNDANVNNEYIVGHGVTTVALKVPRARNN
jgi:hypothetical protein